MSRNASDIFCLNEENTDGNQMFSVHGSCPLKIARKTKPRENECFEYGRSRSPEKPEDVQDRGDAKDFQETDETHQYPEEVEREPAGARPGSESCPSSVTLHRIDDRKGQKVSASSMMRNPLTGAGMEIQEHKKSKKGPMNKDDRWVW